MPTPHYTPNPEQAPLPPATLVIPSRNRAWLLIETVQSVLAGDEVPDEIVVVDQSDERNAALETLAGREPRIRYRWTPEPGVSKARNLGIREACYDVLAFVDDDVRVAPTWFGTILRALVAAGERGVVTGRVLPDAPADGDGFVPSTIEDLDPKVYEGRIWTDILYSNNMALRRSLVEAVGDFDERLGGGAPFKTAEDNELAFRLLEAGFRIRYVPEAVVYHRAWRTWGDYYPLSWSYGYGQGAYYAKHLSLRDRYTLRRLLHDFGHRTVRGARFTWSEPRRALGQFVYAGGLLAGWCRWLVTQPRRP